MNILTDWLPDSVTVGGKVWPIYPSFRVGVKFELLMQDPGRKPEENIRSALSLYYPTVPKDWSGALDALLWFYRCGEERKEPKENAPGGVGRPKKAYDFEQDADLIHAAFLSTYGIDLAAEDLHWWKFRALFRALPQDCDFVRIMGYRTADLSGMGKTQKKHCEKMRAIYALKNPRSAEGAMTLAERNQRMRDYVDRRFREVGEIH